MHAFRNKALEAPLAASMIAAAIVRTIAVFTAKGFMASDDYFVYLHIPWIWSRGGNEWFAMDHPSGFSIVYPGFNYLFILAMRAIGVQSPDHMMYVNRALHAAWSLVAVWYAVRLLQRATDDRPTVLFGGLLAAMLFVFPYVSVRNLPEMVCVPFVMAYLWHAQQSLNRASLRDALFAGMAIGAAFIVRYQALSFAAGAASLFLLRRQWRPLAVFLLGIGAMLLVQGTIDLVAYGKFFGAPIQYFGYNVQHASDYVVGPWYRYGLLLVGIFVPPFSLVFLASTVYERRQEPVLFWSTLVFVVLHSLTPAKQERFIIPALLPICVLGALGIRDVMRRAAGTRWQRPLEWNRRAFWIVNTVLLVLFVFHYGKRGQIEALNYLYRRGDASYVLVDRTDFDTWLPNFYLDIPRDHYYWISRDSDWAAFRRDRATGMPAPRYALILVPHDIDAHLATFAHNGMRATPLEHFGPGVLEWLLWKLNPRFNSTNDVWVVKLDYDES